MQFKLYLEDLSEETIDRIKWVLRYDLADEIDEAARLGVDRRIAERDVLADYFKRQDVGMPVEL